MSSGSTHLTNLILDYCRSYEELRENNLSLEPIAFHRKYGLSVHIPANWDLIASLFSVVSGINSESKKKIVVIFGSTVDYCRINEALGDLVQYFSWHEIFTGMHTAATDIRYIQRSKALLSEADFTFFIDPPAVPEVMNQVCGQTHNCLVILAGGGGET